MDKPFVCIAHTICSLVLGDTMFYLFIYLFTKNICFHKSGKWISHLCAGGITVTINVIHPK